MLVEIGDLQLGTAAYPATIGSQLAEHQFQQRGLTTAVGPHQRDLIAALHLSREVSHQGPLTATIANVFQLKDDLTGAQRLFGLHPGVPLLRTALSMLLTHRFQGANTPLVTSTTRLDPLTDPRLLLRQTPIELGIL